MRKFYPTECSYLPEFDYLIANFVLSHSNYLTADFSERQLLYLELLMSTAICRRF